ncbi:hypothetical protein B4N89_43985 [Embleya scabrispora]|uniref:Uncharacterized protein n=1 Tax=Embleya scabrispora TaxID=159449 RepID=A0A1T3NKX0_9ACTN|nr:hypothetical protein [Embleya scabrispora]OPC77466.1 hypothetical protein B4N89_43985 [Embleya scabrispora]
MLAALLLVGGAVVAAVVLTGGDDSADEASPARSTSSGPGTSGAPGSEASGTVSPVTGELLAAYQPRQVTRHPVEGGIRVTWRAPTRTDGIAGYLAIAQSPSGTYQKTAFPATDTMDAVLSGDPVTADSCVLVVTVIDGTPGMKVAPGGLVCATGGPGAPGSLPPSAAARKPESKP